MASHAAKRYAQAVFSLARERGTLDLWLHDLTALNNVMSDPRAAEHLSSPAVAEGDKLQLIDEFLAGAQPEAKILAHMLIERHRMSIIPEMVRLYGSAVLEERGIVVAEVTTAEPLGPREEELVRAQLSKMVGKNIQIRTQTDPSIIGGIVARIGDQLIDGSVINQLRRLRARLATTA